MADTPSPPLPDLPADPFAKPAAPSQPQPQPPSQPQPERPVSPHPPRLAEADPKDVQTPVEVSETKEAAPRLLERGESPPHQTNFDRPPKPEEEAPRPEGEAASHSIPFTRLPPSMYVGPGRTAEPVVGNREKGRPTAEPESEKRERADEGRDDHSREQLGRYNESIAGGTVLPFFTPRPKDILPGDFNPYDARTQGRAPLHGATHRFRQDVGLGPQDIVERVIRTGMPEGGWVDFKASEGIDDLRRRLEGIGAAGKGITLVAGQSEPVDPQLVRELTAGSIPARLVRRGSHG